MTISFKNALGIHEQALLLRNQRTEILANNIANADTPGYKARDFDFHEVLAAQQGSLKLPTKSSSHSVSLTPASQVELSYRVPNQPSLDGNTVDAQMENAAFARNLLEHQASFQFLNGKFTSLMKAIRGE